MAHTRSQNLLYRPHRIERAIEQAKVARSQFLRETFRLVDRRIWWTALICAFVIILLLEGRPASQRALEGTVLMERLATMLAKVKVIVPDTSREISQLVRNHQYDCKQLACDATLEKRNRIARAKLESLLAVPNRYDEIATNNPDDAPVNGQSK